MIGEIDYIGEGAVRVTTDLQEHALMVGLDFV